MSCKQSMPRTAPATSPRNKTTQTYLCQPNGPNHTMPAFTKQRRVKKKRAVLVNRCSDAAHMNQSMIHTPCQTPTQTKNPNVRGSLALMYGQQTTPVSGRVPLTPRKERVFTTTKLVMPGHTLTIPGVSPHPVAPLVAKPDHTCVSVGSHGRACEIINKCGAGHSCHTCRVHAELVQNMGSTLPHASLHVHTIHHLACKQ